MQTKEMKTEPFTLDPDLKAEASSSLAPDATNGDKVRALRLAQGLSLAELARRTGLTSRAIRYMENNERTPSVDAVRRLSAALGVTTDYFMDNETFRRELQDDAFYTEVRQKYGSRGVAQAKKIQQQTTALFAGGELSGEDQLAFIEEMEEVFLIAKKEAKKYTPKKYQE
ncbi:MAG: helix-turn-helix domain-containing protein [Lachnospiraceae bacterium]|nr:helix-turn-helix domain-containing protein [Lachnospiraceae bacterium]